MTTYRVTAERTKKWWVLQAVDAPGAISQVARLDQADQIKEAIAFVTGEPEETIEIEIEPVLPEALSNELDAINKLSEESRAANTAAAERSRDVARALHVYLDLSLRDVGNVLDISHQRAHQLATEGTEEAWTRLPTPTKVYLCEHIREPLPPRVWQDLQSARFVNWWARVNDDDTHSLEPSAWEWIESRAAAVK
jgi:hypothetical protein